MKYFVVKNFINKQECQKLIEDAQKFTKDHYFFNHHGNRSDLSVSDIVFNDLIKQSDSWKNITNKLNSIDFFKECAKKLDLDPNKFCIKDFFVLRSPTEEQKIYKKVSNSKSKVVPNRSLFKFLVKRIARNIYRRIRFSKIFFKNKKPLELLWNYAKAGNGYSIEIHRDSDSRLIVFLLYLNELTEGALGGNLELYKLIKKDKNLAVPDSDSCEKIGSIEPEAGKIIVFKNGDDSYHGVNCMKNHNDYRHFIYGGFTILSGQNPNIQNKSKSPTEFHLYD